MKKQVYQGLTALLVMATTMTYGQSYDNNNTRQYDNRNYDSRSSRSEDERNYQNNDNRNNDSRYNAQRYNDDRNYQDSRSDRDSRRSNYDRSDRDNNQNNNIDTNSERYRFSDRTFRRYDNENLQQVYDQGYNDGMSDSEHQQTKQRREDYKNFTFGVYAGANSTRFQGETVNGNKLSGRLGYQLGVFARGGGRLYGQLGAEYLTSTSDFYQTGNKISLDSVASSIDQRYIQIPAYIGFKLVQSPRGTSAVRLQVGAEVAAPVGGNMNLLNNATVNGLASIGFDAGPFMLGVVYHYGFADVVKDQVNTKRRILGVNVGIKF